MRPSDDRLWFARLGTADTATMRRFAVVVVAVHALVVAAAPYVSPRAADERGLYAAVGVVLLLAAAALWVLRPQRPATVGVLGMVVPNVAVLILLARTRDVGALPILLLWSALAVPLFCSRATAVLNLVLVGAGMSVAAALSPDELVSPFTALLTLLACAGVTLTVRVVAERGASVMRELADRAVRDPLTGLLNRRGFDERLAELWAAGQPVAVVFFDLDHFKAVNDTYGHACGDAVLCAFADVLRSHVRDDDVVARLGGEEFGLVLPDRVPGMALARAEAVVAEFGAVPLRVPDAVVACTTSAGIAVRDADHAAPGELCRDADRALYLAKEAGRNRAVLHA